MRVRGILDHEQSVAARKVQNGGMIGGDDASEMHPDQRAGVRADLALQID